MRARFALLIVAALLVACGGTSRTETAGTGAASTGGGTATAAGTGVVRQPRGELRMAFGIHMPGTLDATKDGFALVFVGVGETLVRINRQLKPEPWLAESVTQVEPTVWRVKLRPQAKFHDGTPVTAEDVAASFRRSWETQPTANTFIPKDTQVQAVDPLTLEFHTARPVGGFLNSLAAFQFVVHKPGTGGASIMTGPYRPVRFETDNLLELEAFREHWGGPPPIARISIKLVPDANARALALQSGDVDLVFGLPPEIVKGLPPDIERAVIPSTRVHLVLFNHTRPPFNDPRVREATALAVDRGALNRAVLDGLGAVVSNAFPPSAPFEIVPAQDTDVARARQLLDEAGWRPGPDGVRVKDGRRLAFTLYSYPGRAELTPMAVVIQSQLKALGYDIQVQQVQDITKQLQGGDFDASMYSLNTLPTGDPLYLLGYTLARNGGINYGGYSNPQMEAIVEQLRFELDPGKRAQLARQAQEIIKADVPNAYLVAAPIVFAYKKSKVKGFTPNPNDLYFIDSSISVD